MTKQDFLTRLRTRLGGLPREDVEERLSFYGEMIDDGIEDGLTEEEAVAKVGSVDGVASRILEEFPLPFEKEKRRPKRSMKTWEIVLLAVGAVVWGPLAIAAVAVVFSLYAVLWSVVVSLWAGFAALIGGAVGGVLGGSAIAATGFPLPGLALVGAGLVCAGVTVLWFFGCKAATKGAALLTKGIFVGIGRCFGRKERKA